MQRVGEVKVKKKKKSEARVGVVALWNSSQWQPGSAAQPETVLCSETKLSLL